MQLVTESNLPIESGLTYGEVVNISYWGDCREHRIYVSTVFPRRHDSYRNWQLTVRLKGQIEVLISDHYAAGNNRVTGKDKPVQLLSNIPTDVSRQPDTLQANQDGSVSLVLDMQVVSGDHVRVSYYGPNCSHAGGNNCIGYRSLSPTRMEIEYEWKPI